MRKKAIKFAAPLAVVTVILFLTMASPVGATPPSDVPGSISVATATSGGNIVHSIIKAPVTPDGNVAGQPTDLVINLDIDMNPDVTGRSLPNGKTIKVTLPEDFINNDLPIGRALSECVPSTYSCNTAVLLQGWPQHPVAPPLYTLSMEGSHTLVFTADIDIVPGVLLPGPGIKQMHLMLSGFTNPNPGMYAIAVAAETGPGGAIEQGVGTVHILPKPAPNINVTSTVNPSTPNTMYQSTPVGQNTPWPFDVLMWGKGGDPLVGAELVQVNPNHSLLQVNGATVGHVRIDAPRGANGFAVTADGESLETPGPVFGLPTGRMRFLFQAGSEAGEYTVTYSLNGGNSVQMFVTATE
jgi:hypothetical protein